MSDSNIYQAPASDLDTQIDSDHMEFAGFWIRAGASIIDSILLLIITTPLLLAVYGIDYWTSESFINGVWDFLISYIFPAVAVILFWVYKSATPGKMWLGLQVVSLGEDRKISSGQAVGRYIAYYLSAIVLCLGYIWVAFDRRKQGWHDKLTNTAVIKK